MAYYQAYTYTTSNQYLIDLSAFVQANGWTADLDAVYNTTYRRLHIHKGSLHFDMYSAASGIIYGYLCTGFASGSAPNAQPGNMSGTSRGGTLTTGGGYCFVSTADALFIGTISAAGVYSWGCLINNISSKIGTWSDGFGGTVTVGGTAALFDEGCYASPCYLSVYHDGVWSPEVVANGMIGNNTSNDLANQAPFFFNGGFIPFPILLCLAPAADTTKRKPMFFAPGIYRTNGGDLYDVAQVLVIGSDNYMIMPRQSAAIGAASYGDYLFKLGA
jgi:hypothetical protein